MKYHIDESYIDDTPKAFLYQRIMDRYPKSAMSYAEKTVHLNLVN